MRTLAILSRFSALLAILLVAVPAARAADESYKKTQYYRGITASYAVTQVIESDVDGDGRPEVLIAYREPEDAVDQRGGVLILTGPAPDQRVAWHAMFEKAYPEKVSAAGQAITFGLVRKSPGADKRFERTMVHGKDFFFRDEAGSAFSGVKVTATSTLKKDGIAPQHVFDRDLKTGWAEGSEGTGVDQAITLVFTRPVDLALIGVLHGDFRGKRYWLDNNRLHRAEVTVETSSDRYDTDSDVDFEEDLGLGLYGDRVELSFSNRPVMRYFRLDRKSSLSLELKITSVLLGERNDDTYISEVDLVELIPATSQPDSKPTGAKPGSGKPDAPKDKPAAADDWTEDDF
jgi:hypothetical protein